MIKNKILYNNFSDWTFNVSKAEGSYIWDDKGKKLIDFTSGWNVTNLGWNHPEICEAMIRQVKKNAYAPMWTADPIQEEYADYFTKSLPKELNVIARATGGTEANEEAIKTARAYTGRKKIIGFKDTYHGQSFGTLALGYMPEYAVTKAIGPLVPEFVHLDFPRIFKSDKTPQEILADFSEKLEEVLSKKDVAAIVTEAGIITGWGSTHVAPDGYLTLVRKLTKKYGTLLILDEVGTGFSRCGKLYGMEIENVVPDIATFAKGLCNGALAIGTMATTQEIAQATLEKSNLSSTFGWTPVACAVALKTLQIHKRDRIWEKAQKNGDYLINVLRKELKGNPLIADRRGRGMEIGVDLCCNEKVDDMKLVNKVEAEARKKGLHLISDNETNIQIMSPLTISRKDLDQGAETLVKVLKGVSRGCCS